MASYFNRDNVGLPGLTSYFRAESLDERGHAQMLMDFQVQTLLTCWQMSLGKTISAQAQVASRLKARNLQS